MRVRLLTLLVVPTVAALVLAALIVVERSADYTAAKTSVEVAVLADEVAALGLRSLGEQPSVIAGWFNWLRANAAHRLTTRPVLALVAGHHMAKQTPEELR